MTAGGAVPAAFRHDPRKAVLPLRPVDGDDVRWQTEPAVCGILRLDHDSESLGRSIPVPVCATPVVVTGAGVVLGSYDGRVRFLSRNLEKEFWMRRLDAGIYASLVADPSRRRVIACTLSGTVTSFDLRGRVVWSTRTDTPVYATPVVLPAAGVLVVAGFASRCTGLDLETGQLRFSIALPEPWHAAYGGAAAHRDPYASPVPTSAGNVVVACAEHVLCLAPDGTERWRSEIGHAIRASPAALNQSGEIAVCSVDSTCTILDERSGEQRVRFALGGRISASPAVSGDILAVGTDNGVAHGIDVRRRAIVWTAEHAAPHDHTSFSVLPDGTFIATSSRGTIVALSRADGAFWWESSQLLGLADHDPKLSITPIAAPDGSMYCGSYSGSFYHFRFRDSAGRSQ